MKELTSLTRRQIRYLCFRLQTAAEGGSKADPEEGGLLKHVLAVREHMEDQDGFGGWKTFAKTWDVDEKSPLVVINRTSSVQSEWNKVLKKESRDLPSVEEVKKQARKGNSDRRSSAKKANFFKTH